MSATTYGRISVRAAVSFICLLQAAVILFAQRNEWAEFANRPFLQEDMTYHWYLSSRSAESVRSSAGYAGYDPRLFGGVNLSPLNSPSDRLPIFLLTLSPVVLWPLVFNLHYLLLSLAIPPLLALALARFGAPSFAVFYGGLIGVAVFWTVTLAFLQTGLVTFAFVVAAGMWAAAELFRLAERYSVWRAMLLAILPGVLFFIHPAAAVTTFVLFTPVLVLFAKSFDKRVWIWAAAAILFAALLNFHWVKVVILLSDDRISTATYMSFSSWQDFWQYHTERKGFQLYRIFGPLLVVGLTYGWAWRFSETRKVSTTLAIWIVLFLAIYTFGSFIPILDQTQPRRYGAVVVFALTLYLAVLLANWNPAWLQKRALSFAAAVVVLAVCSWSILRSVSWQGFDSSYLASTLADDPLNDVAKLVNRNCPTGSRILFLGFAASPIRDQLCFLAHFAPREYFGEGVTFASLTRFGTDGVGFDRKLQDGTASVSDWHTFRDLWGIEYVLAPAELEIPWAPELTEAGRGGGFKLLKGSPKGRFLVGRGYVEAELNRITFRNVVPADGRIVVAYHYSVGFEPENENAEIRVVRSWRDQYGFLEIVNPPKNFALIFQAR